MQSSKQIGTVEWSQEEMRVALPEFIKIHSAKPIKENQGGMGAPHLFATWFMLRKLNPGTVIESGVWKGLGTWLIEKALPEATIFSIDPNPKFREYESNRARYFDRDFSQLDWSMIPDKADTLLFFDDHQNAFERIKQGMALGFKRFIFEDNYPAQHGDCYSLKKAFQHAGYKPTLAPGNPLFTLKQLIQLPGKPKVTPNAEDAAYLKKVLKVYYEFPPVVKPDVTRWGTDWNEENYFTPDPLFTYPKESGLELFAEQATDYSWICLAELK